MAARAKYKEDQKVEFLFAGSSFVGIVLDVRKDGSKVSYLIKDDRGTKYPVQQDKVIRKL